MIVFSVHVSSFLPGVGSTIRALSGILPAVLLCACAQTVLHLDHLPPAAYKLSALAPREIVLAVEAAPFPETQSLDAGHQYLLVALPFGRISISDPEQAIFVKAAWILSERGYRAHTSASSGVRSLKLNLTDISASGYDLIFARKVICSVELQGDLSQADDSVPQTFASQGQSSAFRRYAFQDELEYHCEKALELALRRLFDYLHL